MPIIPSPTRRTKADEDAAPTIQALLSELLVQVKITNLLIAAAFEVEVAEDDITEEVSA